MLLASLLEEGSLKSILIVAPNTLLSNWAQEFKKWTPDVDVYKYHEQTEKKRLENLRAVQRRGGVLMTTFGLLQNHGEKLSHMNGDIYGNQFVWDAILLDEAHKIKNQTKTTKAVHEIPGKFKVAITGTPIMNNLNELYNIFRWLFRDPPLLPNYQLFKDYYDKPITKSRQRDALPAEKSFGFIRGKELKEIVDPYILRRTKLEIFGPGTKMSVTLPTKYDWIVWVKLTDDQVNMYMDYLATNAVRQVIREADVHGGPLVKLTNLKKLCDHPLLLPASAVNDLIKKSRKTSNSNSIYSELVDENDLVDITKVEESILMEVSAKMSCLVYLLEQLKREGHRTLVFSQSTRLLDIIQRILMSRNFKLARLDGNVRMKDRDAIVDTFQNSSTIDVMLLTTGVGGVGLTLTNADRVVIYDPSWNPAVDSQAIDRAYRIGQSKDVIVYRLITCGSVEEKIFRRQVFKGSVTRQIMCDEKVDDPTRYFTSTDIFELFKFEKLDVSETCMQLNDMHRENEKICAVTDRHRKYVIGHDRVYNISNHKLLFSVKNTDVVDEAAAMQQHEREEQTHGLGHGSARAKINANFDDFIIPARNNVRKIKYPNLENPTEIIPKALIDHSIPKNVFSDPTDIVDLIDSPLKDAPVAIVDLTSKKVDNNRSSLFEGRYSDATEREPDGISLNSDDDADVTDPDDNGSDLQSFVASDNSEILVEDQSTDSELEATGYSLNTDSSINKSNSSRRSSTKSGQTPILNRSDFDESVIHYRRKKPRDVLISDDEDDDNKGQENTSPKLKQSRKSVKKGNVSVLDSSSSEESLNNVSNVSSASSKNETTRMEDVSRFNLSTLFDNSLKVTTPSKGRGSMDQSFKLSPVINSSKSANKEKSIISDISTKSPSSASKSSSRRSKNGNESINGEISIRSIDLPSPYKHSTRLTFGPSASNTPQPLKSILKNNTNRNSSVTSPKGSKITPITSRRLTTGSVNIGKEAMAASAYGDQSQFNLDSAYFKTPTPTKLGESSFGFSLDGTNDSGDVHDVFVTPSSVTTRRSRAKRPSQVESLLFDETQFFSSDQLDDLDYDNTSRTSSPEL